MRKLFLVASLFTVMVSCKNSKENAETIEFKSPKEELSYIVGAEHAKMITQSGDPNISQLDLNAIFAGFEDGIKNPHKITPECMEVIQKLYGPDGRDFNQVYLKEGCNCIGSSIGNVFIERWSKFNTIDQLDMEMVKVGFKHGVENRDTIIAKEKREQLFQSFVQEFLLKVEVENKKLGKDMILKAKSLPNAKQLQNGSVLVTLEEGKGASPASDSDVKADYILTNAKGDTVESSFEMKKMGRDIPAFNLAGVVKGWQDAFPNMKKGGKYRLYLPGELAYGAQSQFEPLIFYIEFHEFGPAGSLAQPNPNMIH